MFEGSIPRVKIHTENEVWASNSDGIQDIDVRDIDAQLYLYHHAHSSNYCIFISFVLQVPHPCLYVPFPLLHFRFPCNLITTAISRVIVFLYHVYSYNNYIPLKPSSFSRLFQLYLYLAGGRILAVRHLTSKPRSSEIDPPPRVVALKPI